MKSYSTHYDCAYRYRSRGQVCPDGNEKTGNGAGNPDNAACNHEMLKAPAFLLYKESRDNKQGSGQERADENNTAGDYECCRCPVQYGNGII